MSRRRGHHMFGRRKEPSPGETGNESQRGSDAPVTAEAGGADGARRLQHGIVQTSRWTVRLLIIFIGLWALFYVAGQLWSVLLPLFFGLLLSTVLWPPVRLLRRKLPNALAALIAVVGLLVAVFGLIAVLAPQVTSQSQDLVNQASEGLESLQEWLAGPPFNLGPDALGGLVEKGV